MRKRADYAAMNNMSLERMCLAALAKPPIKRTGALRALRELFVCCVLCVVCCVLCVVRCVLLFCVGLVCCVSGVVVWYYVWLPPRFCTAMEAATNCSNEFYDLFNCRLQPGVLLGLPVLLR